MNSIELKSILTKLQSGDLLLEQAYQQLIAGPFKQSSLGYAEVDHHRSLRQGISEVIFGAGKTIEQILSIAKELQSSGKPVLITRISTDKISKLIEMFPGGRPNTIAQSFVVNPVSEIKTDNNQPYCAVISAGTSDLSVAEEASEVCISMEVPVLKINDIGVSGIHRLMNRLSEIQKASALVVVAGMEGALPSVIGGLVEVPVFAVPTSVGYGASFQGLTALLAMLNSCAPGIGVFNIDNGFGAGVAAARVVRLAKRL